MPAQVPMATYLLPGLQPLEQGQQEPLSLWDRPRGSLRAHSLPWPMHARGQGTVASPGAGTEQRC